MIELGLELGLYFSLVRVFCIFRKFLDSIFDQKISQKQQEEVKQQKLLFLLMTANIVTMMVVSSCYELLLPYLFIHDLFATSSTITSCYIWLQSLYYVVNLVFAITLLFTCNYLQTFGGLQKDKPSESDDSFDDGNRSLQSIPYD